MSFFNLILTNVQNPEREEEWLHVLAKESFTSATWCDVCEKGFESVHKLKGNNLIFFISGINFIFIIDSI